MDSWGSADDTTSVQEVSSPPDSGSPPDPIAAGPVSPDPTVPHDLAPDPTSPRHLAPPADAIVPDLVSPGSTSPRHLASPPGPIPAEVVSPGPTSPRHLAPSPGPMPRPDPSSVQSAPPAGTAAGSRPPRDRRRRETVALCVVGALVVAAGVAVMVVGRDGDGGTSGGDATPASTSGPGGGAAPAGPIVGATGVLGSWSGTEWQPWDGGDVPGEGADFSVVRLDEPLTTAVGGAVADECAGGGSAGTDLDLGLEAGPDGTPPPIAVAGIAKPRPRTVEVLDTGSATYLQAAAEVATGLGATTPPTLAQVLRSDLDGDGTEEVVVTAEHLAEPDAAASSAAQGEWSVVFLRRVAGNGVDTSVVASSLAGTDGVFDRLRVSALADLNGDGTMELAVSSESTDGPAMAVYAADEGGPPSEVLRAACPS